MGEVKLLAEVATTRAATRSFYSFFDEPRFGYNFLTLLMAALGVGLGLWALWLAYHQLRKTLDAAEAARKASEETAAGMRRITTVVNAVHLSGLCGQLLHLLRDQNLDAAAIRLQDLRVGVAELRSTPSGLQLQQDDWWVGILVEIYAVQEVVEVGIHKKKMLDSQARMCIKAIGQVEADLRSLTAKAAHGAGV